MRLLLTTLFLLITCHIYAQNDVLNTEVFWKTIYIDSTLTPNVLTKNDTVIIVASNRKMDRNNVRFMAEKRDKDSVRFFVAYVKQGNWHVLQVASLKNALRYMPDKNKDWVVYTEGMGKIFTSDMDRGFRMAGTYNTNVLLLDYPSIRTNYFLLRNYFFAIHNARIAYKDLTPVIDSFKQLAVNDKVGTGHITLFFHSMGNNVAWKIAQHKLKYLNNTVWADNIVLNSACVPQRHHTRWLNKIHFAKRIYVDYNPNDHTLHGAHLVSFRKQLGEEVKRPVSPNAYYINFSQIVGERHSNFMTLPRHAPVVPAAIHYYKQVLHGDAVNLNNQKRYKVSDYDKIGWDILPQGDKHATIVR